MSKLRTLLLEYSDKFNENFPTYLVMGKSEKDIIKLLEKSIKSNKEYTPKIIKNVVY